MPVTKVHSWVLALALVSLAIFAIQVKTASLFPLVADIYPARDVATVWGMSGAAGSFGAALFQWLVGYLVDGFSYYPVFVIVSTMCLVQAAMVSLFIRRVAPLPELAPARTRMAGGIP